MTFATNHAKCSDKTPCRRSEPPWIPTVILHCFCHCVKFVRYPSGHKRREFERDTPQTQAFIMNYRQAKAGCLAINPVEPNVDLKLASNQAACLPV